MNPNRPLPRRRRALRSLAVTGLALTLVGGVAACGDDDDEKADAATTTAAADPAGQPGTDPTPATGDAPTTAGYTGNPDATIGDQACDPYVAAYSALHQMPEDPGAVSAYFDAEVAPSLQELVDALDGDAQAAARAVQDTYRQIASSGDMAAMGSPELAEAQATLGAALHEGCDWAALDIEAVDYAFENAPSELPAGRYSFALENTGIEEHEMVLFRRNDGVTESFEELSEMGEAMMEKVEFTGVAFGGPGTTSYAAVDLEPGTYFMVCFIPVGGAEDGPPHFVNGMQTTIEVV